MPENSVDNPSQGFSLRPSDNLSTVEIGPRSLAHFRLLADVPAPRLAEFEARCVWRTFKPNEMVLEHDDSGTDVYFVARGKVRITSLGTGEGEGFNRPEENVVLAEIDSGEIFGELSAIDGQPRSARAVSTDYCLLAQCSRQDFLVLLLDCPKLALALLQRMASFVRTLNQRVHSLSTLTPAQRIYGELVRISEPNPTGDGTWVIQNLPPHGDIAGWAGVDREDVATAIGQLAREGLVERRHRSLLVRNYARLKLLAHQ